MFGNSPKQPTAKKALFLPKTQGEIGLIEPKYNSLAMRLKHFFIVKEEHNQGNWISFTKHILATVLIDYTKTFVIRCLTKS